MSGTTTMTTALLRAELVGTVNGTVATPGDPLGLGYAALISAGNDAGLALLLNTQNYTVQGPIPIPDLIAWLGANALYLKLQTAAKAGDVAAAIVALIDAGIGKAGSGTFDATDATIAGLIQSLVTAGTLTAAQQTSLLALGNTPASRAHVLWGLATVVTVGNISLALRGY